MPMKWRTRSSHPTDSRASSVRSLTLIIHWASHQNLMRGLKFLKKTMREGRTSKPKKKGHHYFTIQHRDIIEAAPSEDKCTW